MMDKAAKLAVSIGASWSTSTWAARPSAVVAVSVARADAQPSDRQELVRTVVAAIPRHPVMVKHRAGWDQSTATHPVRVRDGRGRRPDDHRPRPHPTQGFSGKKRPRHHQARARRAALHIPLVGNGDVTESKATFRMREHTGWRRRDDGRGGTRATPPVAVRAPARGDPRARRSGTAGPRERLTVFRSPRSI